MFSPIKSLSHFFNPMDLKKSLPFQWNKVFAVALAAIGILVLLYREFVSRQTARRPAVRQIPMNEQLIRSKNHLLEGIFPRCVRSYTNSRIILIVEKDGQRFHQSVTAMDSTMFEAITHTFNEKINHIENLNEIPRDAILRLGIIFTNPNLDVFTKAIGYDSIDGGEGSRRTNIRINERTKQLVSEELNIPTEQLFDN